jgi:hypothetical protein
MSIRTQCVGTIRQTRKGVVEAVAAGTGAERLADAHRHEVAEHCEARGVDARDHVGETCPQERLAVAWLRAVQALEAAALDEALFEAVVDRSRPV